MVSSPRFQDNDFEGPRGSSASTAAPTGPEAVERLLALLQELAAYATHYLAARVDATRGRLRRMAMAAALVAGGALVSVIVLSTAAILLTLGLAQALTALFGGPAWVGNVLAGGGLLSGCAILAAAWMWRINRSAQTTATENYEQRKRDQRERFGRDASGPAATGSTR
ncbi:MAG: hypothetical protein AB7O62_14480 [Pirellulales bacterium]